ncbi:GNAT family N-acetyltransferase [Rheinheimera fenheensis]|uniref:GNAT family N-acetyltransferase n=1 Tax=Rheinheimera fenheensis TaxID=3152295 RepID=UPI00325E3BF3
MKVYVKRALEGDVAKIAPLFNEYRVFYRQKSDIAMAIDFLSQRLLNNESVIFVAENYEGLAVGFTQLYPSFSSISAKRSWILNDLYVTPNSRRMGLARRLMEAARNLAAVTNAKGLCLQTEIDNTTAQALYESLGYKRLSDSYFYYLAL